MFDIDSHRAWADFKAWLLHREDMDRRARGEPPLEIEIARQLATMRKPCHKSWVCFGSDPDFVTPKTQKHSTPPN